MNDLYLQYVGKLGEVNESENLNKCYYFDVNLIRLTVRVNLFYSVQTALRNFSFASHCLISSDAVAFTLTLKIDKP